MIYGALNPVLELLDACSQSAAIPGAPDVFRVDNARYRSNGRIDSIVHHDVRIQIYRFQLVFGTSQSSNQRFGIFGAPGGQALYKRLRRRGKNENEHRLGEYRDKLLRSLYVDVHDHMPAFRENSLDFRPERPVEMPVNLCRFSKLARRLTSPKRVRGPEVVIAA